MTELIKSRELNPRNKDVMHCCWQIGQGWDVGGANNVAIAANNLRALGGKVGVYGYKCEQISCHDDTEIVLCNDNAYYINPDAPYLASYAEDILRDCHLYQWFGDHGEWFSCDGRRMNMVGACRHNYLLGTQIRYPEE
ncbi:hypothetical protein HYFRA_00005146 [Hymenoscyphus fraxineus]|uniref:Uncharacterized protein n=1 Tax=Hymenoscyphus fraxineus TaxID=746836 RepID=A0A9N9LCP5_9HELO|nr:hypothetical protein HYFRA_00005146 [Hymenoscyphus fraxineus]